MHNLSDRHYLLTDQYKDAANLDARIQLHARFSTNPYGWHRWVFDQLELLASGRVLEVGCGPGRLWLENMERLSEDTQIALSDLSIGMVREAREALRSSQLDIQFLVADAQALPFPEEHFDVVVANHMLYHVPDRERALAEIHRVLRPGGRFCATTIGRTHMRELGELAASFDLDVPVIDSTTYTFTLETGLEEISRHFREAGLRLYEDSLRVTEAAPLVAYVLSGDAKYSLVGEKRGRFVRFVEEEIAREGAIHITKASGMFVATK